jgi:5-methylcytosine-specific restriction endonuclease McrA
MEPVRIASWEDAITLVVKGHAEVLEEHDEPVAIMAEKLIECYRDFMCAMKKTANDIVDGFLTIRMPSVIRLVKYFTRIIKRVKFSKINVFTRDRFTCQYCGFVADENCAFDTLTYEHVVPRSRGGKTEWTNIVTACRECNTTKANRTPDEAGMKLARAPVRPSTLAIRSLISFRESMPPVWKDYLVWQH